MVPCVGLPSHPGNNGEFSHHCCLIRLYIHSNCSGVKHFKAQKLQYKLNIVMMKKITSTYFKYTAHPVFYHDQLKHM